MCSSDLSDGDERAKARLRTDPPPERWPGGHQRTHSRPASYSAPGYTPRPSTNPYDAAFASPSEAFRRGASSSSQFPSAAQFGSERPRGFDGPYAPPLPPLPPNGNAYGGQQHLGELQHQVTLLSDQLASEQREGLLFREVAANVFGVVFRALAGLNSPAINDERAIAPPCRRSLATDWLPFPSPSSRSAPVPTRLVAPSPSLPAPIAPLAPPSPRPALPQPTRVRPFLVLLCRTPTASAISSVEPTPARTATTNNRGGQAAPPAHRPTARWTGLAGPGLKESQMPARVAS